MDRTDDPDITITRSGWEDKRSCERVVRVLDGFVGQPEYGVHNASIANLARGVVERVLKTSGEGGVLGPPVRPVPGVYDSLREFRAAVLENTSSTSVVSVEDYPSLYHDARKRALYERAVLSLSLEAISQRDAVVNTFVKAEKVNFSAKSDPAPRVIQPRSPRYNVCVGRYLKPFEKNLFDGFRKTVGYPVICKGMNAAGTANQLRSLWDSFDDPVAVGLDASRFDQHVSQEALKFEHGFYNGVFHSAELAELLSWQLNNEGLGFVNGLKLRYKVRGCRMSGDINTSMGNCVIMCSIVLAYFMSLGLDAKLANNGDDCVVVCERKHLGKLDGIGAWFLKFGFKLTREAPVYEFEHIEFCQTHPVWTEAGWRMVRNPYTATSKDMVSLLPWDKEVEFDAWRGAIGSCGLSLTAGVPFWESFYSRLGGVRRKWSDEKLRDSGLGYMARGMDGACIISDRARYSFWLAYGMLPDEQIALESMQSSITFGTPIPLTFGEGNKFSELLSGPSNNEESESG